MADAELEANRAARPRANAIRFMGFLSRRSPGGLPRSVCVWTCRSHLSQERFPLQHGSATVSCLDRPSFAIYQMQAKSPRGLERRQIFGSLTVDLAGALFFGPHERPDAAKNSDRPHDQ